MKKTFLALAAMASVSLLATSDALAVEVTKGRVLNHKEWTSGNVKAATLKPVAPKEIALKFKSFHKMDPYSFNFAASIIDPLTTPAFVGVPAEISGYSFVTVENNSQETKVYDITSRVCANDEPFTHCAFFFDEVELEAGGHFMSGINPVVTVAFAQAGAHEVLAGTDLATNVGSAEETLTISQSLSTVDVGSEARK